MKRAGVLGTIVTVGMRAVPSAEAGQPQADREGGRGRDGRWPGFPPVGMIAEVPANLHMIPGAGGNGAVNVADNGAVLVDTKLASNGQAIDLYYFGPTQPLVDANNGGSGFAYGETIGKAAAGIKNVHTVITGHSTMAKWQDFVDYCEFDRLFLCGTRASLKAGKTAEQAMADLKLPDEFKDCNLTGGRGGPGGNFNVIFQELQKQQTESGRKAQAARDGTTNSR